jgi:polysaccharide export outer membrane protein
MQVPTMLDTLNPGRFYGVLLCCSILALGGCVRRRITGPPIDVTKPISVEALKELINNPDMAIPYEESYRIGPGDAISIQLIGRPDVFGPEGEESGEYTLTDNPLLALPMIGAIRVHGKTARELEDELRTAYSRLIINPEPLVIVKSFQANQVAVLGQVRTSGKYPIEPGDTLMDVILKAGGANPGGVGSGQAPNRYLKVYREKIDRQERASLTLDELISRVNEDQKILPREEITVPIEDYLVGGQFTYNIPVKPNDIIYVPHAGSVSVQGRMSRPGIVFLGPSMRTVRQVMTQAGGLRFGASSIIQVVRPTSGGQRVSYYMNARQMANQTAYDFMLQDGDELYVDAHPFRVVLEYIGNMLARGTRAGVSASYNPITQGAGFP